MNNEATVSRMSTFLDDALRSSCEGIMVKSLDVDARYTPSKRSDAWLKVCISCLTYFSCLTSFRNRYITIILLEPIFLYFAGQKRLC